MSCAFPFSSTIMTWTNEHDLLLHREVLVVNPYTVLNRSIDRGNLWGTISSNLNSIDQARFFVDRRLLQDHLAVLVKIFNKRMKDEEKQSGISPHLLYGYNSTHALIGC